jgi:hypothetical protein
MIKHKDAKIQRHKGIAINAVRPLEIEGFSKDFYLKMSIFSIL